MQYVLTFYLDEAAWRLAPSNPDKAYCRVPFPSAMLMMLWRTSKYEISCCGSSPRSACVSGSVPPRVTVSSRCVHSGLSRRELPMSTHEGNCLSPEQIKEESWSESITGRSSWQLLQPFVRSSVY
jgi:hypothetical protein